MALRAFRQYGDQVLRLAYCYTGSVPEAEKITQQVFLTLQESQREPQSGQLRELLLRETVRMGNNRNRRGGKLAALPADCAAVLYLHDHAGCTIADAAAIFGRDTEDIECLLAEGRNLLRLEGNA